MEVGVRPQMMRREVTPSEADLAFNFYVPKEDLKEEPGTSSFWRGSEGLTAGGDRGRIRLDLYQVGYERGVPRLTIGNVGLLSLHDGVRDPDEGWRGGIAVPDFDWSVLVVAMTVVPRWEPPRPAGSARGRRCPSWDNAEIEPWP